MTQWTLELQKLWEATWDEPHMCAGLARLWEKCRIPGDPTPVVPGVDLKEVASQAYAHAQGQSNIVEEIERMKPHRVAPSLPPAFTLPRAPAPPEPDREQL